MKASIVDLRKNIKDIQKALARREEVTLTNRGAIIGVITPPKKIDKKERMKVEDHPFFGSGKDDLRSVEDIMKELRKPRFENLR